MKKETKSLDMANMCGGRRCCPKITRYDDGSLLISDEGQVVEFTPEQAVALEKFLTK